MEAEEVRSRRHGGTHGLLLVEIEVGVAGGGRPERAALAIAQTLREIDLVARVDDRTFGVLVLHCDDIERVQARLGASLERAGVPIDRLINAPFAGADLRSRWMSLMAGLPVSQTVRLLPFVASPRIFPN